MQFKFILESTDGKLSFVTVDITTDHPPLLEPGVLEEAIDAIRQDFPFSKYDILSIEPE